MSATTWLSLGGVLLVLAGGALVGLPAGAAWERRRARRMRALPPTMVLPPIPPAPAADQMRQLVGPICKRQR